MKNFSFIISKIHANEKMLWEMSATTGLFKYHWNIQLAGIWTPDWRVNILQENKAYD
jgi:hypothetical protein